MNLRQVALWSVAADTAISLLAGLAVFPVVFAFGLDPASGPGLVFVTLPIAFAEMPFGVVAASAFFLLLFVAALASAISLLELAVPLIRRRTGWGQAKAAVIIALTCFVAGIATVLSFNLWSGWHPLTGLAWAGAQARGTVFDLLDYLTSNLLLPLVSFGIAVFAGWVMPRQVLVEQLQMTPAGALVLGLVLRWVVPAGIAAVAVAMVAG